MSLELALSKPKTIADEFDKVPQNKVNIAHMPRMTEGKNRYFNILPNNHSRYRCTRPSAFLISAL